MNSTMKASNFNKILNSVNRSQVFILETPRLIVRRYTIEDADHFFELNNDEEVMRYIRSVKNREECDAFLLHNISFYKTHPNLGRWAAFQKATREFIGSFAIIPIEEESGNIQIGYALKPSAWGKGYATELVLHGKKYFFEKIGHDVLHALTEQPNVASQKVLIKCGFKRNGTLMAGDKELVKFSIQRNQIKE